MTGKDGKKEKKDEAMAAPRVGVFVCHCGKNIGGFLDVPAVVEYAKTLPNVAYAEHNLYTCSQDGLRAIKENIKKHNLNRVIVASCTPRTHAPLFQSACEEAGVNKYLFEFVNIRDQCSWVHMKDMAGATRKAKDLVRMGVARAVLLGPLKDSEMSVVPVALVIGGGIAGMTVALNLANRGMEVHLVEKTDKLGGMVRRLDTVYPSDGKADELIIPMIRQVEKHKNIKLHMSSTLEDVKGYIGHFQVTVGGNAIEVGTIIVATGADVLRPDGLYGYGRFPNVITQLEFEDMLKAGKKVPKRVAFIQCAGSRSKDDRWRPYCSKVCCMVAIKNAKKIRNMAPDTVVYVLHRDINATGTKKEVYYYDVRGLNVKFMRYSLESPPELIGDKQAECIKLHHETLGTTYEIPVDLVVLSTPMVPNPDNTTLSKMLKVPLDKEGFFLEAHVKLRPLEFATEGIYLCGCVRFPTDLRETVLEAYGAAAKASIPMASGKVWSEATVAEVDPKLCVGCGTCEKVCPFGAPGLKEEGSGVFVSAINAILCKGCGVCVVSCPSRAIALRHFTDEQISEQIRAALEVTE